MRRTGILAVTALLPIPLSAQDSPQEIRYFPQFAVGGGAETFVTVNNTSAGPQNVIVALFRSDGTPFLAEQLALESGATETVKFGGAAGEVMDGWVKVTAAAPFASWLFFKLAVLGNVGVLPAILSEQQRMFNFTEDGSATGLAMVNPDPIAKATVSFRIFDAGGNLESEVTLELEPQEHFAQFLSDPPFNAEKNGSVEIISDLPVGAVTLRIDGGKIAGAPIFAPVQVGEAEITSRELADSSVTSSKIADAGVTADKIAEGTVVRSLNALRDELTLTAGNNVTIDTNGNQLTLNAGGPGSGFGIQQVSSSDDSLDITNPVGPTVDLVLADGSVTAEKLAEDLADDDWVILPSRMYSLNRNVGISTSDPNFGFSLGPPLARTKFALFENSPTNSFGLGVLPGLFVLHLNGPGARFGFFGGDNDDSPEVFTVRGSGEVSTNGHFRAPSDTDYRFPTKTYKLTINFADGINLPGTFDPAVDQSRISVPLHLRTGHAIKKVSVAAFTDGLDSGCSDNGVIRVRVFEREFGFVGQSALLGEGVILDRQGIVVLNLTHAVLEGYQYYLFVRALKDNGVDNDSNCTIRFDGGLVEMEGDRFSLSGTG